MNNEDMTVNEYRELLKLAVEEDDRQTVCACCGHRVRDDRKDFNRWMALAIKTIFEQRPLHIVHAATFLQQACPEATRDHCVALARHWGLLEMVDRPPDADKKYKGSRGLTGFYRLTDLGRLFAGGNLFIHKTITRKFGTTSYVIDETSPLRNINTALKSSMAVRENNMVRDGTTA